LRFTVREWPLLYLYKIRNKISFPVYQRGLVWDTEKKRLLVDSIFRGIDIPKLYLQKTGGEEWDCIDGHQRIQAIVGFFDGEFKYEERTFEELGEAEKRIFEDYKLTITEVDEISEEEVRLLFTRLQLGVPLNAGEKLNAIKSKMGEFVKRMKDYPFIKNTSIPSRRFAKEQVCAQICNNSSFINKTGAFRNSKYEDLENLYRAYANFDLKSDTASNITHVIDKLNDIFGEEAREITNRASVVSIYLMVEEMIINNELDGKEGTVKGFYVRFLNELREEVGLGIDATSHFLISYQSRVIQAADSRTSVAERHDKLKFAFEHFQKTGDTIR
jgi:uncharacterized protein with ParB-like and HNH nuclease domain